MAFKSNTDTVIDNESRILHTSFATASANIQSTEVKIKPSDGANGDFFGLALSIGSGRVVAAISNDDDNGNKSGSAYIFDLNGTQLAKIKPSDGAANDQFGVCSVGSGRIVVGAYGDDDNGTDSGSAYIFDLNGTQLAKIKPSDGAFGDYFGLFLDVKCGRIVVCARQDDDNGTDSGSAYIFDLNGTQLTKIKPSDGAANDNFGYCARIGMGRIIVGSPFDDDNGSASGSAYIFDLSGNQLAKIKPSDGAADNWFGYNVAIGCGRIVVGAPFDTNNPGTSGAFYVFDLNGKQLAKFKSLDAASGDSLAGGTFTVNIAHGLIIAGASGDDDNGSSSGSAYIFDLDGNQLAKIKASDGAADDNNGIGVAIGNDRIIVGSWLDDDNGSGSGSAYIYKLPQTSDSYFEDIIDTYRY